MKSHTSHGSWLCISIHLSSSLYLRSDPIMRPLAPDTMIQAWPWMSSLLCDCQPSIMGSALCIFALQCFQQSHLGPRMSSHVQFLCFSTSLYKCGLDQPPLHTLRRYTVPLKSGSSPSISSPARHSMPRRLLPQTITHLIKASPLLLA